MSANFQSNVKTFVLKDRRVLFERWASFRKRWAFVFLFLIYIMYSAIKKDAYSISLYQLIRWGI